MKFIDQRADFAHKRNFYNDAIIRCYQGFFAIILHQKANGKGLSGIADVPLGLNPLESGYFS